MGGMFDFDNDGKLSDAERMARDYFIVNEFFDDTEEGTSYPQEPSYNMPPSTPPRPSVYSKEEEEIGNKGIILLGWFFIFLGIACLQVIPIMTLVFVVIGIVCFCNS